MQRKPVSPRIFDARRGFYLASLLPFCIASANALELNFADGEVTGRFDNTVSYGVATRLNDADPDLAAQTAVVGQGAYSDLVGRNVRTQANKNDGNLNFADKGDIVSNVVKWNSLLELTWQNYGAQVSGFAFHDFALEGIDGDFGAPELFSNNVDANDIYDGRRLPKDAADYAVNDVRLSSAYVWGDFEIGERTVNVRLGEQVLSWGEALFMQDGINQANPADLSALRLPGAEVKDALLPLPMLVVSTNITDALSAEAFYEFGWRRSEADPVGTFYSTTDAFFGYGSESVIVDLEGNAAQALAEIYNFYHRGIPGGTPLSTRVSNNKLDDVQPADDGQFGVAFRYMAESLNNTEFGLFFLNTHARKPTAGAVLGEAFGSQNDLDTCQAAYTALQQAGAYNASYTTCTDLTTYYLAGSGGATAASVVGGMNAVHYLDSTSYFLQYKEDLQVYGFTFSTNVGETSLSGEVAFRPDAEFLPEVGDNLIIYNALNASILANGGTSANFGDHIGSGQALAAGQTVDVTASADMINASLLAIHNFGPTWIADGLTGVVELGGAWVQDLDKDKLYAAESALAYVDGVLEEGSPSQYLDDFAWGYRLVVAADFNNVGPGLVMKPQIRLAHDVRGNGIVGGNFVEDRKSATFLLDFEYGSNWTFGLGMNQFWGRSGTNQGNQLADRDSAFANVKYSF